MNITHHTLSWGWLSLAPEQCQLPFPERMCLWYTLNRKKHIQIKTLQLLLPLNYQGICSSVDMANK